MKYRYLLSLKIEINIILQNIYLEAKILNKMPRKNF